MFKCLKQSLHLNYQGTGQKDTQTDTAFYSLGCHVVCHLRFIRSFPDTLYFSLEWEGGVRRNVKNVTFFLFFFEGVHNLYLFEINPSLGTGSICRPTK